MNAVGWRASGNLCSILQVCIAQHQKDQALSNWQLLVQALVISRLDYCNALLAGLPSCTIKPLQMIQNAAARLVFKRAHVTPLFISLHWLPVASRIKFKTLMLAYRTTTASAPAYFHWLIRVYIPSKSLRSTSERHLVVPSQRGSKSFSRTFSFPVPGWWNDLPTPIQNAESLTIFKRQLKTHLFQHYFILNLKKNTHFVFPFIYSFLACTNLNNAWNLVLWALPVSVCLFKKNRFLYSPIVSRFG